MKVACQHPACDETATSVVIIEAPWLASGLELKVCATHLPECERTARRQCETLSCTVTVKALPADHPSDCLCPVCARCACKAIDAGRLGFCRDHRRAFIPADTDATSRELIIALAKHAGIPLSTTADGGQLGQPS